MDEWIENRWMYRHDRYSDDDDDNDDDDNSNNNNIQGFSKAHFLYNKSALQMILLKKNQRLAQRYWVLMNSYCIVLFFFNLVCFE